MNNKELESITNYIQNKETISRKISIYDLNCNQENIYENHNEEKIKSYRKQGEYGQKKFIKP